MPDTFIALINEWLIIICLVLQQKLLYVLGSRFECSDFENCKIPGLLQLAMRLKFLDNSVDI